MLVGQVEQMGVDLEKERSKVHSLKSENDRLTDRLKVCQTRLSSSVTIKLHLFLLTATTSLVPPHSYNITCSSSQLQHYLFLLTATTLLVPPHSSNIACSCSQLQHCLFLLTATTSLVPAHSYNITCSCSQLQHYLFLLTATI